MFNPCKNKRKTYFSHLCKKINMFVLLSFFSKEVTAELTAFHPPLVRSQRHEKVPHSNMSGQAQRRALRVRHSYFISVNIWLANESLLLTTLRPSRGAEQFWVMALLDHLWLKQKMFSFSSTA